MYIYIYSSDIDFKDFVKINETAGLFLTFLAQEITRDK